MNNTVETLNELTREFLKLHAKLTSEDSLWSIQWKFRGEIPNQDKQGVYAFLNDAKEVIYIGVGASKGDGIYEGAGLGRRLSRIWQVSKDSKEDSDGIKLYEPTDKYSYIDSIVTFAFDTKEWYLAYALEYYLISKMKPEKNRVGKG